LWSLSRDREQQVPQLRRDHLSLRRPSPRIRISADMFPCRARTWWDRFGPAHSHRQAPSDYRDCSGPQTRQLPTLGPRPFLHRPSAHTRGSGFYPCARQSPGLRLPKGPGQAIPWRRPRRECVASDALRVRSKIHAESSRAKPEKPPLRRALHTAPARHALWTIQNGPHQENLDSWHQTSSRKKKFPPPVLLPTCTKSDAPSPPPLWTT